MNKRLSLFLLTALCASAPVVTKASADSIADEMVRHVADKGMSVVADKMPKFLANYIVTGVTSLALAGIANHYEKAKKKAIKAAVVVGTVSALAYWYVNNPESFNAAMIITVKIGSRVADAIAPYIPTKEVVKDTLVTTASAVADKAKVAGSVALIEGQKLANQAFEALPSKETIIENASVLSATIGAKISSIAQQVIDYAQPKIASAAHQASAYAQPYIDVLQEKAVTAVNALAEHENIMRVAHGINDYLAAPVINSTINSVMVH